MSEKDEVKYKLAATVCGNTMRRGLNINYCEVRSWFWEEHRSSHRQETESDDDEYM